jgi:uncharacterized protein with FMN-binding domain
MRRITLWLVGTVCGLVLLFSYRTSTTSAPPRGATTVPAAPAPAPAVSGGTTVDGSVAQTRWGPVQVRVTIAGGKIVDVTALQVPNGNRRDDEINSYAVPQLRSEVLSAQSARIDSVSGATVTSDGYRRSLQAALDAAHFGS